MNGRARILERIRRALRTPSTPPAPVTTSPFVQSLPVIGVDVRPWLPPTHDTWDEQAAQFAAHATALRAEFIRCADLADLETRLAMLAQEASWQRCAFHAGMLTERAAKVLPCHTLKVDADSSPHELERCDAALTECDALIAQTGSVLLTNRSAGGRALSALAPHHVVLATRDQLLPDLTAAFALLAEHCQDNPPSLISLVTGPSRTGDIERILVLGAHGPKRLTIFCV